RDLDGVDRVAELGDHLAVVGKVRNAGEGLVGFVEAAGVDLAEADELDRRMRADVREIGESHVLAADAGDVQFLAADGGIQDAGSGEGRGGGGTLEERATGEGGAHEQTWEVMPVRRRGWRKVYG